MNNFKSQRTANSSSSSRKHPSVSSTCGMRIMLLGVMVLLATGFFSNLAVGDELSDVNMKAEKSIEIKYTPGTWSYDREMTALRKIRENPELSDDEKIKAIKKRFLDSTPITQTNAGCLVYVKPLVWHAHSLSIAYDVEAGSQTIISSELLRQLDAQSKDNTTRNKDWNDTTSKQKNKHFGVEGSLGGNGQFSIGGSSLNPFAWTPRAELKAQADASIAANYKYDKHSKTEQKQAELWSAQEQQSLTRQYSEITKNISNIKTGRCHLLFSIVFRNNCDVALIVDPESIVPVYAGKKKVMDARLVKHNTEYRIPPHASTDLSFSEDITDTTTLMLVKFMREGTPEVRPESGLFHVKSVDNKMEDVAQDQENKTTFTINCGPFSWNILKTWNKRNVTLRQALWAVNAIYEEEPFKFSEDGKLQSVFGCEPKDEWPGPLVFLTQGEQTVQLESLGSMLDKSPKGESIAITILGNEDGNEDRFEADIKAALPSVQRLAVEILKKKAEGKREHSCFLGYCYQNGLGVKMNPKDAVKWYRKAAEQVDARAQNELGNCYYDGYGVKKDLEQAVKWYRKAAEQGDVDAQTNLGICYQLGDGVEKNPEVAVEWLRKAAEQGYARAQYNLGMHYKNGIGVERNPEVAVEWLRKAAEQGYARAQYHLGYCYDKGIGVDKNPFEAVRCFRKAAEQGDADAQNSLGCCYRNGIGVEKKDAEEAVRWYRKAAEKGYAPAQANLGVCYYDGIGVKKNPEEAVRWYLKAAEQGYADAQHKLGYCYFQGIGVERNLSEVAPWHRKAAEQGHAAAQNSLGVCYQDGIGVEKDSTEAVKWYRKAAAQGNISAQYNLGYCYDEGIGVEKNRSQALFWYRKAAEQGDEDAKERLHLLQ